MCSWVQLRIGLNQYLIETVNENEVKYTMPYTADLDEVFTVMKNTAERTMLV